jgi:hypothetical protein
MFLSAYHQKEGDDDVPHVKNNWVCPDFKGRIVPTHCAITTNGDGPGYHSLIETSADGRGWRDVNGTKDSGQLNDSYFTGTFAVAEDISRNDFGCDLLYITKWEVSGRLVG